MRVLKIDMHRPAMIEPVDCCDYSYRWFETQWKNMKTGNILITIDGSYVKTDDGFAQF